MAGKKQSQLASSTKKISKNDKKQMNTLIKVLRPKVYITESSNFKRLVQELTGNGNGNEYVPVMPNCESIPPSSVPLPIESSSYQELSLDSSVESSEASMHACSFTTESPVQDATFNVFETQKASDFPVFGDIESWLLETDHYNNCDDYVTINPHTIQQQYYSYDYSDLMII